MEKHNKISLPGEKMSVNVASTENKDKATASNTTKSNQNTNDQGNYRRNNNNYRGGRNFNWFRDRGNINGNRGRYIICHVCNKPGHIAIQGYHRFD